MLRLRNVDKAYPSNGGEVRVLRQVDLSVERGEFVAVQGPSGAGKSTLLFVAGGLLRPTSGTVEIDGVDVYALPGDVRADLRARAIGFMFQQFHLVPYLSARENVLSAGIGAGTTDAEARASELLDHFGLSERADHRPGRLSVGERQRTALARALLNGPRLLLADEPTGNLDEMNSTRVLDHFTEFAEEGGAVLLVTHDNAAASRAHRRLLLEEGQAR